MGGPCSTNGEEEEEEEKKKKKNAYRLLVEKPEGKRPLGRSRRRRVDNIRMDLGEVGWVGLAKDWNRWSSCQFGIEPWRSMKCWETIEWPNI
jgi:hypothetical protein